MKLVLERVLFFELKSDILGKQASNCRFDQDQGPLIELDFFGSFGSLLDDFWICTVFLMFRSGFE
jgi:hypothetical protein